MNKLLKSILTLSVVAIVAVGATSAYFSDTETSTGNRFVAGAIDLTVDSEAHYNGLICDGEIWVNKCEGDGPNLLTNGDFEVPVVNNPKKWDIFPSGTSGLGWSVAWVGSQTEYGGQTRPEIANLELHHGVLGNAQHGDQYAELDSDWFGPDVNVNNEPALVSISQTVSTTPGQKYYLSWWFAGRPNTSAAENAIKVEADGNVIVDIPSQTGPSGAIVWYEHHDVFEATTNSTTITFIGQGPDNSLGVFLDNVVLQVAVCDSNFSEYEGRECNSTWEATDLGPEHQFFYFDDIKPGDEGENTVSLHVDNNDAWACLHVKNLEDNDPNLTEPEKNPDEGNDQTEGPGNGELSQNIMTFMWFDNGNNVYEEDETPFDAFLEEPIPASEAFNNRVYPISIPGQDPLLGGETSFVGIAWCAGDMVVEDYNITCNGETMGNEAQTDEMIADLSFYVEQSRNNDQFSCESLLQREVTSGDF